MKQACGGHDALMAAAASGEVKETTDPKTGRTFYVKETFEAGHFKKKNHKIMYKRQRKASLHYGQISTMKADEDLEQIDSGFSALLMEQQKWERELKERKVPDKCLAFIKKAVAAAESTAQHAMNVRMLKDDLALPNASADRLLESLRSQVKDAMVPLKRWLLCGKLSTGQTLYTIRHSVSAAVSSTKHLNDEVRDDLLLLKLATAEPVSGSAFALPGSSGAEDGGRLVTC